MLKNKWLFLLTNLFLALVLLLLFAPAYNLIHYINYLFYINFFYLLLTLFIYTINHGFYDGVTFGFRRFFGIMSKNKDHMEEWKERALPSEKMNNTFYRGVQFQGVALFVILVILLVIYYL
ncbi:DUF3899 domain-containing protein [Virgibacillus sp. NKC19-16]|uniref:DUF3899 domain-containing protein n=1 Tax=Virgibacillus salidurans TaxID=2831673 RepID=UPI001F32D3BA|nr:DUF3899 domain-containing protein [Virgibacillus sp. NKC19-16]UJL46127.1 DUF3899 domain-containing protein [Virgibacillus sp. NKC19-16]